MGKIFQIGFNKCGTTSIHRMLVANGINSVHWDKGRLSKSIKLSNILEKKTDVRFIMAMADLP